MREISEHDWDRDPNAVTDYAGLVEYTTQWRGDDLVEFLRARLGEDEATARDAGGIEWCADRGSLHATGGPFGREIGTLWTMPDDAGDADPPGHRAARHIARHDPARVLREVAAGRELLAGYERLLERQKSYESHCRTLPHRTPHTAPGYPSAYDLQREGHFLEQVIPLLEGLVKVRAAVYADHPDCRQGWKPAG